MKNTFGITGKTKYGLNITWYERVIIDFLSYNNEYLGKCPFLIIF